ncbi:MAG: CDP-diacylglycerol--glycerol-3-phosphate 3-phosphatidyltransferase [Clostridiales bacterium]|nr:CDP-diacylglycerol--glycerol-3-phosphate 3-phosphatidyltransferase [Clostridiales bacterium]
MKLQEINLPNRITLVRVLLIPLFVVLALWQFPAHDTWAALVFAIAAASDAIDGRMARRLGQVTTLGKFLDPLADKLLICSAYVALLALGRLNAWMVIVIICREIIVNGIRILAADANIVIAASSWGKLKTTLQSLSIVMLFLVTRSYWPQPFYNTTTSIILWLALLATVISGADYIRRGIRYIK